MAIGYHHRPQRLVEIKYRSAARLVAAGMMPLQVYIELDRGLVALTHTTRIDAVAIFSFLDQPRELLAGIPRTAQHLRSKRRIPLARKLRFTRQPA